MDVKVKRFFLNIWKKVFSPEQDPDLLSRETDPRIRIRIKMKRIYKTAFLYIFLRENEETNL